MFPTVAGLLSLLLAAPVPPQSTETPPGGGDLLEPAPRGARWYEVDAPDAAPLVSGLTFEQLAAALSEQHFDGAIVWIPAASSLDVPVEPRAKPVAREALPEPFATLLAPLFDRGLRVAAGKIAAAELDAVRGGLPSTFRTLWLDEAEGRVELRRAGRPAVTSLLFYEPSWRPLDSPDHWPDPWTRPLAISDRLLRSTLPELRTIQARLDLATFGGADPAAGAGLDAAALGRVLLQSRIARALALQYAGSTPERYDPLHNVWSGGWLVDRPSAAPAALRRGPPWLDLEECSLTPGAMRSDVLTPLLQSVASSLAGATALAGPPSRGVLDLPQIDSLLRLLAPRRAATVGLGRWLLFGQEELRERVIAELKQCSREAARLGDLADEWQRGLEDDRALVAAHVPWRVRSFDWQLSLADRPGTSIPLTVHQVDDERALGFGDLVTEDSVGEQLPLSRLVALDPERPLLLRTELPLVDPRAARLEIDGGGRFSLRVNGVELLTRFDAVRQRLTTTLPLAAGRNVVELELLPIAAAGDPALRITVLPHRIEGVTIEPKRALRTQEPVVRLRDPAALAEECLVWPEGRTVGGKDSGSAELPFEPLWTGRTDVWIHVLHATTARSGEAGARLDVALDDGIAQALPIFPDNRWQWLRLPAPLAPSSGPHRLVLTFRTPGLRVDAVTCFETGLGFPHRPAGDGSLFDAAWRFDPLGTGIVIEIPPVSSGDLYGPNFKVEKSGSYQVYVWLRGRDPLQPGEAAEVDVSTPSGRTRFVVPFGTPYEEWTAVGSVNLISDERVELRSRGRGSLTRVTFLR